MFHRRRISHIHASLLALLLPLAALAQQGIPADAAGQARQSASLPELQAKVREAFSAQDYGTAIRHLGQMRQQLPFDGKLLYEMAAAYALNGDAQSAFNTLVRIQQQGLAYSPRDDDRFEQIKQYELFDYISKHLEGNGEPFDQAEAIIKADAGLKWPQAIARIGADGDFLVAGLGQGRIVRVTPDGETETFFEPSDSGPQGVSALAVDPEHGHLWAAGTAVRTNDKGLSINMKAAALYRFDLESGELQGEFPIGDDKPLPHLFNEIAIGPDGRVFVADSLSPLVYSLGPEAETLEAFMGSSRLTSFHGLAITPDGEHLFVSDWVTGIYRIKVSDQSVQKLAHDPTVNLGGIHSLSFRDGELFAVQTGTKPQRVVRIQLSDDLTKAVAMFPLSANEAEYDRPGLGELVGDGYFFVANSGWSLESRPTDEAGSAVIMKADPDLARDRMTPAEMRESAGQRMKIRMKQGTSGYEPPGTDEQSGSEDSGG